MAFGEVLSVTVMNDKYIGSGQSRGYAFVEMTSKSEGESAITALNGQSLKQRTIDVIQAPPFQITKTRDSSIAEELAALVAGAEKECTKSVELPAII